MATYDKATCEIAPRQRTASLRIRDLEMGQDATAFRVLNEEWITRLFELETKDIEVLADPHSSILKKGGRVFLVSEDGKDIGCVALIHVADGVFELSKMAVAPIARGRGIGRKLVAHAIEQARRMGARSLFLGSSTKLPDAVHLYETSGFRHVPINKQTPLDYARADIFMELVF